MTIRSHRTIVTFKRPFLLEYIGKKLPAGNYEVVTEEELLEGLSFYAYHRLQTYICRQSEPDQNSMSQSYVVDPDELDDAIKRDGAEPIGDAGSDYIGESTEPKSEDSNKVSDQEAMNRASDDGMPCHSH